MASTSRGSFCGKGGALANFFRNIIESNPPMNARQPSGNQAHLNGKPSGCRTGRMLKDKSTKCISHAHAQSGIMMGKVCFTSIRSSVRNGMKKWPKMMIMLMHHHEPCSRPTYQKVSSGMLAFQMMKYCAK